MPGRLGMTGWTSPHSKQSQGGDQALTVHNSSAAATSSRAAVRTRSNQGRLVVRLVTVVFAFALAAAVAFGLWEASNTPSGPAPKQLASLSLAQVITGPDAVAQMSKLHGKGVGVVDGYIAHYQGANGGAVLYVGQMGSAENASTLAKQMEARIGAGNQHFTGLKSLQVEGTKVFTVRSGPETHYFWKSEDLVNWIGFDMDDPLALAAAVRALR